MSIFTALSSCCRRPTVIEQFQAQSRQVTRNIERARDNEQRNQFFGQRNTQPPSSRLTYKQVVALVKLQKKAQERLELARAKARANRNDQTAQEAFRLEERRNAILQRLDGTINPEQFEHATKLNKMSIKKVREYLEQRPTSGSPRRSNASQRASNVNQPDENHPNPFRLSSRDSSANQGQYLTGAGLPNTSQRLLTESERRARTLRRQEHSEEEVKFSTPDPEPGCN